MAHSIKQNKLAGTMLMKLQTSDFLDKNFKRTALGTLRMLRENMNKEKGSQENKL